MFKVILLDLLSSDSNLVVKIIEKQMNMVVDTLAMMATS